MSISQVVKERADALLRRFNDESMPPLTGAVKIAEPGLQNVYPGGKLESLDGHARENVLIWRFPEKHRSSVWARKTYPNYRQAYLDFISLIYGIDNPTLPPGQDVDHIHNRARAPDNFMLRLEAVHHGSNRSHGSGYEKRMGNSEITAERMKTATKPSLMTFVSALKLAGILSPLIGENRVARLRDEEIMTFFVSRGWQRAMVQDALKNLAEIADRR